VPIPPRFAPFPVAFEVPVAFGLTPEQLASLKRGLLEFVQGDSSLGVPIETEVVEAPIVHRELVAQATRLRADLIVMGTHGRGGVAHLLMGSVAERVVRTARCPVLTTRGLAEVHQPAEQMEAAVPATVVL